MTCSVFRLLSSCFVVVLAQERRSQRAVPVLLSQQGRQEPLLVVQVQAVRLLRGDGSIRDADGRLDEKHHGPAARTIPRPTSRTTRRHRDNDATARAATGAATGAAGPLPRIGRVQRARTVGGREHA